MGDVVLHPEDDELDAALAADGFPGGLELAKVGESPAAFSLDAGVCLERLQCRANQGNSSLCDDAVLHGLHTSQYRQDLTASLLDPCFCWEGPHDSQDKIQEAFADVNHLRRRMRIAQSHRGLECIEHNRGILRMNLQHLDNAVDGEGLDEACSHCFVQASDSHELDHLLHGIRNCVDVPHGIGYDLRRRHLLFACNGIGQDRLATVCLTQDGQSRACLLVYMLVHRMPVHSSHQCFNAFGIDDGHLGIVRTSHHAQSVGTTHLNTLRLGILCHGGNDAIDVASLQKLGGCLRPKREA
mmetsp:Transcript_46173/g.109737  ORF Transcript_46173/g.109737 Transcript_46173/m.109737 type:complete len:298 (-) Transcript_46173:1505-2398(-)